MSKEQEPRSVTIGLSGWWLDHVGIPPDVSDNDLAEFVDTIVKDNPDIFAAELDEFIHDYLEEVNP